MNELVRGRNLPVMLIQQLGLFVGKLFAAVGVEAKSTKIKGHHLSLSLSLSRGGQFEGKNEAPFVCENVL